MSTNDLIHFDMAFHALAGATDESLSLELDLIPRSVSDVKDGGVVIDVAFLVFGDGRAIQHAYEKVEIAADGRRRTAMMVVDAGAEAPARVTVYMSHKGRHFGAAFFDLQRDEDGRPKLLQQAR